MMRHERLPAGGSGSFAFMTGGFASQRDACSEHQARGAGKGRLNALREGTVALVAAWMVTAS